MSETLPAPAPSWLARAAECVRQEPLFDTRMSQASLRRANACRPPRAVYLGIGLCFRDVLSRGVPVDLLGVLLPAESLRRAIGAERLVVLVADRHAEANGFCERDVADRARAVESVLDRARDDCGLEGLEVVRASDFHGTEPYHAALAEVRRARPALHEYVARQLADALCLDRHHGGLLKVGWALRGAESRRRRDELAFDRELRVVAGERISFAYCKPGRALSDDAPRVPPYAVRRPGARLCLDRPEDARAKLKAGWLRASAGTVRACRRHLRALLYTYDRLAEPLPRGPLERRVDALLDRLGEGSDGGAGSRDPEPPERATG